jgi:ubiquitin carboxyl-terminal hydrolase L5
VKAKEKAKEDASNDHEEETYHFIGYVPAYGKVWELDGLKSGPLEVGELPLHAPAPNMPSSSSAPGTQPPSEEAQNSDWMSIVRPALRMKMEKYGGSATSGTNIRFSLLAIVDDLYQKASDEFEFLKREKIVLERKMQQQTKEWKGEEWLSKVGVLLSLTRIPDLLQTHRSPSPSSKHRSSLSPSQTDPLVQVVYIPERSPPEK